MSHVDGSLISVWSADVVKARDRSGVAGETLVRMLYADHGRAMLAYATRLTGDRATAEYVVQEALVTAWRHAHRLADGRVPVRARLLIFVHELATKAVGVVELSCSPRDTPNHPTPDRPGRRDDSGMVEKPGLAVTR
jgi:RNA polymerase sigma-70 factor (ECF subfamily)